MASRRIVVADTDRMLVGTIVETLQGYGFEAVGVYHRQGFTVEVSTHYPRLLILSTRIEKLISAAHDRFPAVPVITLLPRCDASDAAKSLEAGAVRALALDPLDMGELVRECERFLSGRVKESVDQGRQAGTPIPLPSHDMIGESAALRAVRALVEKFGPLDAPVLVTGETGVGKELVARAIHAASGRAGRYVAVNCAALPAELLESELFGHARGAFTGATHEKPGLFEEAGGGTLLLDEIGSMPLLLQAKLLRVLQERSVRRVGANKERPVDVRVVAATNEDLNVAVLRRQFRPDLFHRLDVLSIHVPPLRERPADISVLAARFARGKTVTPLAMAALVRYGWPGNVRELESAVARAVALAGDSPDLLPKHFSERIREACAEETGSGGAGETAQGPPTVLTLREWRLKHECAYVLEVLNLCAKDVTLASQMLRCSVATIYRKIGVRAYPRYNLKRAR